MINFEKCDLNFSGIKTLFVSKKVKPCKTSGWLWRTHFCGGVFCSLTTEILHSFDRPRRRTKGLISGRGWKSLMLKIYRKEDDRLHSEWVQVTKLLPTTTQTITVAHSHSACPLFVIFFSGPTVSSCKQRSSRLESRQAALKLYYMIERIRYKKIRSNKNKVEQQSWVFRGWVGVGVGG